MKNNELDIFTKDLEEAIDFDEWAAIRLDEVRVDFATTAKNLHDAGYRKVEEAVKSPYIKENITKVIWTPRCKMFRPPLSKYKIINLIFYKMTKVVLLKNVRFVNSLKK